MNKTKLISKSLLALLILFIMFLGFTPYCYASSIGDSITGADDFISAGGNKTPISTDLSGSIYNILLVIGIVIAVIVGLFLGIQFMWGSVQAKSKVKEALVPYIAGCVVIFGAFGIWKLVVTILQAI